MDVNEPAFSSILDSASFGDKNRAKLLLWIETLTIIDCAIFWRLLHQRFLINSAAPLLNSWIGSDGVSLRLPVLYWSFISPVFSMSLSFVTLSILLDMFSFAGSNFVGYHFSCSPPSFCLFFLVLMQVFFIRFFKSGFTSLDDPLLTTLTLNLMLILYPPFPILCRIWSFVSSVHLPVLILCQICSFAGSDLLPVLIFCRFWFFASSDF